MEGSSNQSPSKKTKPIAYQKSKDDSFLRSHMKWHQKTFVIKTAKRYSSIDILFGSPEMSRRRKISLGSQIPPNKLTEALIGSNKLSEALIGPNILSEALIGPNKLSEALIGSTSFSRQISKESENDSQETASTPQALQISDAKEKGLFQFTQRSDDISKASSNKTSRKLKLPLMLSPRSYRKQEGNGLMNQKLKSVSQYELRWVSILYLCFYTCIARKESRY